MAGSTISTTIATGVTLGVGYYASPLTVTPTGAIVPAAGGATGLLAVISAGYVQIGGTIAGGDAASGTGGYGLVLTDGSLSSDGTIAGGSGSVGGIGVALIGGRLTNGGTIGGGLYVVGTGDTGYGRGGLGVYLAGGSLTNTGTITGGTIDGFFTGGGGTGVDLRGGDLTNYGAITGGGGRTVRFAGGGPSGYGVIVRAGSLINDGTIAGGTDLNLRDLYRGGIGALVTGGNVTNNGTIAGGGKYGRTGAFMTNGNMINAGTIIGGTGGGTGVDLRGGALTNDGTIAGATGFDEHASPLYGPPVPGGAGGTGAYVMVNNLINHGAIVGGNGGAGRHYAYWDIPGGPGGVGVRFLNGGTLIDAGFIGGGTGVGGTAAAVSFGSGTSRLILEPGATFDGAVVANASYSNVLELATGISAGTLSGGIGSEYQGFSTIAVDFGADWTLTATNTLDAGDFMMVYGSLTVDGSLINDGTITGGGNGHIGGGSAGVVLRTGSLTNHGTIVGSAGGFGAGPYGPFGGNGGTAVELTNGSLTNDGIITGGEGGYAVPTPGANGRGGTAVELEGGRFTNNGTILGGAGGGVDPNDGLGGVGVYLRNGGTLTDAGFIGGGAGNGGIAAAVVFGLGASRLLLNPGASFDGAVHAYAALGNVMELATGGSAGTIASLGGTIAGFGTIQFDAGANWLVEGNAAGLAAGQTIDGFALTDTIELTGFVQTGHSFTGDGLVLTGMSGSETIAIQGTFATSDFNVFSTATDTFVELAVVPCFAAGTRISTDRGKIAVESLQVGDIVWVLTGDGSAPVIWIGRRTVTCTQHPRPKQVWPVRIVADAFGAGRPCRDLWLSPDHAVFVGGVLIPVKYLINNSSIAQVPVDAVTYFHVELARHSVLLAEGLQAESYLDTGDRTNFADSAGLVALHPDFGSRVWEAAGCAPLIVAGSTLQAVRGWLNARPTALASRRGRSKAHAT
jgi:hypothetical protein